MDPVEIAAIAAATQVAQKWQNEPPKPKKYPVYHSFLLWLFFGGVILWLPCIYYFLSDKHKFKFF